MSWTDYQRWRDRGSPFRLMQPARDLRDRLRAHGYTVYDIGNESHLTHEPPEDHTPYSETAYPGSSVYGVGYAVDIMPPAGGARSKVDGLPLPSLARLGAQLTADRKLGEPGIRWLKYINWEPQGPGGPCYHDSWQPKFARRASTDRGHIHISGLTGYESSTIGAGYDPVTRVRGGDDMSATAEKQIAELHAALLGKGPATYPASTVQQIRDVAWVLVKGPAGSSAWVGGALTRIAEAAGISPDELEAITAAAREGAAAATDQLVAAVVAKLPATGDGGLSRDQVVDAVEQGVREAFAGGLAPDRPADDSPAS